MSGLAPLVGHEVERRALARAHAAGVLPPALLFHGAPGIGKQRLALWLGQLLLCDHPSSEGPCGACKACGLCRRIEHPDLHWFFPLPRPKGTSSDRLGDALEDARAGELEARRADPWYTSATAELVGIFLAHAQVIRRLAASRPAMARRQIFIVGDAELLVSQEASPEAANALLKLLEEPSAHTTMIVTSSEPEALLPTIRSRLSGFRLRPLPIETVAQLLVEVRGLPQDRAGLVARLAEGSIGTALAFVTADGEAGPYEEARASARDWLEAACSPDRASRYEAGLTQSPAGARGGFSVTLRFFILWLRDLAAVANGAEELVLNTDGLHRLRHLAARCPGAASGSAAAVQDAEAALQQTQWNVNPQLVVVTLLRTIAGRLADGHAPGPAGLAPRPA